MKYIIFYTQLSNLLYTILCIGTPGGTRKVISRVRCHGHSHGSHPLAADMTNSACCLGATVIGTVSNGKNDSLAATHGCKQILVQAAIDTVNALARLMAISFYITGWSSKSLFISCVGILP